MPFVPVPSTVEVRMVFRLGVAEQMVNVLHFLNDDDAVVNQDMTYDIATAIEDAWVANLQDLAHEDTFFAQITAKDISAAGFPTYVGPVNAGGAAVDDPLPNQLALCTTLRTTNGTRGGRGRIFFGGYSETCNDDTGRATAALRIAQTAFVNAIRDIPIASADPDTSLFLGVTSKAAHAGGDPEGAPIAPITRPVVAVDTNTVWDTQRRRSNKLRF